jgi:hypothetical protein
MKKLICPHCHARVPNGATVCRGCKAEIEYGTPGGAQLVPWVLSAIATYLVLYVLHAWLHVSSIIVFWIVGLAFFIGVLGWVGLVLEKRYANRVVFHRFYRTAGGEKRSHERSR